MILGFVCGFWAGMLYAAWIKSLYPSRNETPNTRFASLASSYGEGNGVTGVRRKDGGP